LIISFATEPPPPASLGTMNHAPFPEYDKLTRAVSSETFTQALRITEHVRGEGTMETVPTYINRYSHVDR
jgi:hypothetical protein